MIPVFRASFNTGFYISWLGVGQQPQHSCTSSSFCQVVSCEYTMFIGVVAFLGFFAVVTSKNIVDLGDERWILQNPSLNISVPGSVPSHAHLDLLKDKVIDEPTYGTQLVSLSSLVIIDATQVWAISHFDGLRLPIGHTSALQSQACTLLSLTRNISLQN